MRLAAGKELEPWEQFCYGRELYYHRRWEESLKVFEQFLGEGRSWMENNIDVCCHRDRGYDQEVRAPRSVLYGAIIITRQFKGPASLYRTWRQPLRGSKAVLIYQALYGPTMPVRRSEILGGNGFDPHWIFALQICLCAAYEEVRSRLQSWWDRIFSVNERHAECPYRV